MSTDSTTGGPVAALPPGDADTVAARLAAHPFTTGLDAEHVEVLAHLAGETTVPAGGFVFRHGRDADACYLLTAGDVALEVAVPGQGPITIQTLHAGDVLGWSWAWPPRRWHLDAHCRTDVSALVLDAALLREALAAHPELGYLVVMRIGGLLVDRLEHARDQLVSAVTS